jgi:hypothetical protein
VPVPETTRPPLERAWSARQTAYEFYIKYLYNNRDSESGSARRWSRQSSTLSRRPPSDESSTPTIPRPSPCQNSALPSHYPERSPSRISSQSQKTLPGIISSLHVASKRTSTPSSVYSVATTSSNPQHVGTFSIARGLELQVTVIACLCHPHALRHALRFRRRPRVQIQSLLLLHPRLP